MNMSQLELSLEQLVLIKETMESSAFKGEHSHLVSSTLKIVDAAINIAATKNIQKP